MELPSTTSSTPVIKRSHSEIGSDDEDMVVIPLSSRRFASRVVDVYVGDERFHYAAHEAFLFQSEELKHQYDSQNRGKKGTKKKENVLNLPRETANEFGQLLEYLYVGKLTLHASEPEAQADELLTIWTMGSRHSLRGMQHHVIHKLEELDLASKLPTLAFLRLADKLYESEVDNGLRRYFQKVATEVVGRITTADMPVLLEMITEGGSFASDLFHAHHQAFGPGKSGPATAVTIKVEDSEEQRAAKRARTDKDTRTEWDKANNIPIAMGTASTEDKLLVTWAEDKKRWSDIAAAWENATGKQVSIEDLVHRYKRINANVLRLGKRDSELLMTAKAAVEAKLNTDKWPLIAARIAENGGTKFDPYRLQCYCDALDAFKVKAKGKEDEARSNGLQAQSLRPGQSKYINANDDSQLPTEIVGGVRVENSKPLGVVRRRRARIRAPTAAAAKKPSTTMTKITVDVSDNSDEDTEMVSSVTREASALFVDSNEEDGGPVNPGVKISNGKTGVEGNGRTPGLSGKMRHDVFMDGPERGVTVAPVAGKARVTNGDMDISEGVVEEVVKEVDDDEVIGDAEVVDDALDSDRPLGGL